MSAEAVFADTNLFLRYLTNDVPEQAEAVEQLLQQASSGAVTLVTNTMVVAEIIWTLESYYERSREDIKKMVLAFLNTEGLEIDESGLILQAITWYVEKNIDYMDAYHAAWMIRNDITRIFTFDQKHFSRLDGIVADLPTMR